MRRENHVEAVSFLSRMHGESQPILVQADDGESYVTKFAVNMQGPLIVINEVLGSETFRSAGLPTPEWRVVHVSDRFINKNRECWFQFKGQHLRPCAGFAFGSRFIGSSAGRTYDYWLRHQYDEIRNRDDFWIAWAVDVLLLQLDSRQVVFKQTGTAEVEAHFIDFGSRWFKSCNWNPTQVQIASRYADPMIYPSMTRGTARRVCSALQLIDPERITDAFYRSPFAWKRTEGAIEHFNRTLNRISNPARLAEAAETVLSSYYQSIRRELGTLELFSPGCAGCLPAQISTA